MRTLILIFKKRGVFQVVAFSKVRISTLCWWQLQLNENKSYTDDDYGEANVTGFPSNNDTVTVVDYLSVNCCKFKLV